MLETMNEGKMLLLYVYFDSTLGGSWSLHIQPVICDKTGGSAETRWSCLFLFKIAINFYLENDFFLIGIISIRQILYKS